MTDNNYQTTKETARYYDKLEKIYDNDKKKNDNTNNNNHDNNSGSGSGEN